MYSSQLLYLYEGGSEIVVEVLVNLLLIDVGQQARDRLEHEDQHQQDRVLNPKIKNFKIYEFYCHTLQQLTADKEMLFGYTWIKNRYSPLKIH